MTRLCESEISLLPAKISLLPNPAGGRSVFSLLFWGSLSPVEVAISLYKGIKQIHLNYSNIYDQHMPYHSEVTEGKEDPDCKWCGEREWGGKMK